ncbi:hypothetical protein ACWEWI_22785 [Streptomyces sp. NPDC003753]
MTPYVGFDVPKAARTRHGRAAQVWRGAGTECRFTVRGTVHHFT